MEQTLNYLSQIYRDELQRYITLLTSSANLPSYTVTIQPQLNINGQSQLFIFIYSPTGDIRLSPIIQQYLRQFIQRLRTIAFNLFDDKTFDNQYVVENLGQIPGFPSVSN